MSNHYAIGESVKVIDGCFSPEYGEVLNVRYGAITGRIIYDVKLYGNNGTVPFFANEIASVEELDRGKKELSCHAEAS